MRKQVAATTIDRLKVVVAAAEAREALGFTLARSKMPPQPVASRGMLHCMMWSTGCWLGHLDPRVGLEMLLRRSLAAPCGSQTLFGAAFSRVCRRGTMKGTHFFGSPRPQPPSTPMLAIRAARLVSGLSGPDSGMTGARFASQLPICRLMIPLQPVLARRQ